MDDTSTWAQHRPRVVAAAAGAVRGVDAEEAASRALVKMLRLAHEGVVFEAPLAYWRRAAVNEACSLAREAARARPVEDDVLDELAPPALDVAALETERQADVDMLRRALDGLTGADRDLLWSRHVDERSVTAIAEGLDVRPHAVTVRLRRAEERLAAGFAAAHAALTEEASCRAARAGMHAYLKGRLSVRRRRELEQHVDGCAACTRAFVDVREVSWGLKAIAPWLGAGAGLKGAAVLSGTAGATAASRRGRTTTAAVAGGVLAVAAGVAAALVLGDGGDPAPAATVAVMAAGGVAADPGAGQPAGPGAASPSAPRSASASAGASADPSAPAAAPGRAADVPGTASRSDDAGRSTAAATEAPDRAPTPVASPSAAGPAGPAPGAAPSSPAAAAPTAAARPTSPGPTPSSAPVTTPSATPSAPETPEPTASPSPPVARTVTVELPVRDLAIGLYRIAVSDGAAITGVSAPHADTWVYHWVRDRWYVQVWRTSSPHVVTVTLTGPPGSTAWLRAA
ncbi:zf-HC2 domain-containing protein [Luteimicrobium sp. DT211]|uniref:zf-HC2 domain-containing protein n=1 Tax=Luteimicrobium sp. DT211 TaxID=3393412 RepID=UPI003CF200F3